MNIMEAFPAKFLTAEQIGDATPVVIVEKVEMDETPEGELRPAVYFVGKKSALMLNKTNARTLAEFLGDDTDGWPGQRVQLFTIATEFQGKAVRGLRVRQPIARAVPPPPPPSHLADDLDDSIPF
jgi:hypothetical protein